MRAMDSLIYGYRSPAPCLIQAVIALTLLLLGAAVDLNAQVSVVGTQSVIPQNQTASPYGVVVDSVGNLYVSDTQKGEILCFSITGSACGIPFPISAGFIKPEGMAIDESDDLFVADAGLGEVLEIVKTPTGYASPVILASSLSNPCGVALDPSGNLFVVASGSGEIYEMQNSSGKYGPSRPVVWNLDDPSGIAIDYSYYLYVSQTAKSVITRYAGIPGGYGNPINILGSSRPGSVAVDPSLNIYVSDLSTDTITSYTWNYTIPHPVNVQDIGEGLDSPGQVAVSKNGTVYIADSGNNRLLQFTSSINPFAEQAIGSTPVVQSFVLTVKAGTTIGYYQAFTNGKSGGDFNLATGGTCSTGLFTSTSTCTVNVSFTPQYSGLRKGAILVEDGSGNVLCNVYLSGSGAASRLVSSPAAMSTIVSGLNTPTGVAIDDSGNLYVADSGTNQIYRYGFSAGTYQAPSTLPVYALNDPQGIAIDGGGNLYIASSGNDRVIKFLWNGQNLIGQANVGTGMYVPSDVAIGKDGTMCVANTYENQVDCYLWSGNNYTTLTPGPNYVYGSPYGAAYPLAVAIDSQLNIYWVQPYYDYVTKLFSSQGHEVNYESQYTVNFPSSISLDGEGDLYVLDSGNNRVLMLIPVGNSYESPVVVATGLNAPQSMTIDSEGNIYVADTGNHRVVKITMSQAGPTQFSNTYIGAASASGTQAILVTNVGDKTATISSIIFPPDFTPATSNSSNCAVGTVLLQGQSCAIAVDFLPQSAGNPINETITYTATSGTGSPQTFSIPVSGVSQSRLSQSITFHSATPVTYGQNAGSIQLVATSSSGLAVQFTVMSGPGSIASGSSVLQVIGAGTIVVKASQAGNGQYGPAADVEQAMNVMPAPLTVTALSKQVSYGASMGSCEYSITGFVQGDNAATSVSGNPVITCGSGSVQAVGSYPIQITQGSLSSTNYQFTFVPGTLTVSPSVLEVIPQNTSIRYGDSIPQLSYSFSGFMGTDNSAVVSGSPLLTTSATSKANVGNYAIQCLTGSLHAVNYSFSCQSGTLSITPVAATVVPGSQLMVYGSNVPPLSYAITGLLNGDASSVLQGIPELSSAATNRSPAGIYPIQCNAGAMQSINYVLSCSPATITVTKRMLTVSAASLNVVYGSNMPGVDFTFDGFVNGDTPANAVSGSPAATTSYRAGSAVGTYSIVVSTGTLSSTNYTFAFNPATITVFPAMLYLAPDNLTVLSGAPIPPLTYKAYGLINGETMASATTGSPTLTTAATPGSLPGQYPIVISQGSLRAPNYTILCMNRTLTILSSSSSGNGGTGLPAPVPIHGKPLLPHSGGATNTEKGDPAGMNVISGSENPVTPESSGGSLLETDTSPSNDNGMMLSDGQVLSSFTTTTPAADASGFSHSMKACEGKVQMSRTPEDSDVSIHESDSGSCRDAFGVSSEKSGGSITEQ